MQRWLRSCLLVAIRVGAPAIAIWVPGGARGELMPSDYAAVEGLRVLPFDDPG